MSGAPQHDPGDLAELVARFDSATNDIRLSSAERVHLTPRESLLLRVFIDCPGVVHSAESLGSITRVLLRQSTLAVWVNGLRNRLEAAGFSRELIQRKGRLYGITPEGEAR